MNSSRFFVPMISIALTSYWTFAPAAIAQLNDVAQQSQPAEDSHPVSWLHSHDEALRTARTRQAPVLLIFGAEWCGPCRLLDAEIEQAAVELELKRWVPVHIDIDDDEATATHFAISSIPALRILSPDGRQLAAREGLVPAEELTEWLQANHATAIGDAARAGATEKLNSATVHRVLRDFSSRESTIRESAISRILTVPQYAAANVVAEFPDAQLAERLAYLEVLTEWNAPVDGLDPWIPDTVTAERISALEEWVTKNEFPDRDDDSALTAANIIDARRLLRRLASADSVEAAALREQLARMGPNVLPLIRELIASEINDEIRARLATARYRVAASDQFVTAWPGGIERLASADYQERIAAMQEFSRKAAASDENLLSELVTDPVPLIREIALNVLAKIDDGRANGPLLKMLSDPDPNVRAAVLKTLSQTASLKSSSSIVPAITNYISKEQDIDLVVHAIRCLRGVNSTKSVLAMLPLLDHTSWRVRAEAVECLGTFIEDKVQRFSRSSSGADATLRRIYGAIVASIKDEDGFVVSKAIAALSEGDTEPPINVRDLLTALDSAVNHHPELAKNVFGFVAKNSWIGAKYRENLQKFGHHDVPEIRAAAIAGLVELQKEAAFADLTTALKDNDEDVRTSALNALGTVFREKVRDALKAALDRSGATVQVPPSSSLLTDAFESLKGVLSGVDPSSTLAEVETEVEISHSDEARDAAYDEVVGKRTLPEALYEFEPALTEIFETGGDEERFAAARCLSMLGNAEAIPYVLKELSESDQLAVTKNLLTTWPWELRRSLFQRLQSLAATSRDRLDVANVMAEDQDPRTAPEIWRLLADEHWSISDAVLMFQPLWLAYSEKLYYEVSDIGADLIGQMNRDSREMIVEGKHWQPLLGLLIQNYTESEEIGELARQIVADTSRPVDLRSAAFHFQLIAQKPTAGLQSAYDALKSGEPRLASIALKYLALGNDEIATGPGGFHIRTQAVSRSYSSDDTPSPIVLSPPEGLMVEMLQPYLAGPSAEDAIYASHLMSLVNNFDGLPRLIDHWKINADDLSAQKLLYQAIAFSNDPKQIPVLQELYETMSLALYSRNMADFYWTIRTMTGPEIMALRKRIRDEQGAHKLRR